MTTPIPQYASQPPLPTFIPLAAIIPAAQAQPTTPAMPPKAEPPRRVFQLYVPVVDAAGTTHATIALREPELRDRDAILATSDGAEQIASAVAKLSGLAEDVVKAMAPVNFIELNEWITERVEQSLGGPAPLVGDAPPPPVKVITLDHPVGHAERRLTEITVKAPTLGATIGLKKAQPADQSALLYHRLTGVPMDLIKSLALVDVAKIEAYFAPFSQRPVPRPEAMTSHAAMAMATTV